MRWRLFGVVGGLVVWCAAGSMGQAAERWVPVTDATDEQPAIKPAPRATAPVVTPAPATAPVSTGLRAGQRLPAFSAKDLNGRTQTAEIRGEHVVLLHFWATWCPFCRSEIPTLKDIQQRWGDHVTILAVGVDDDRDDVSRFARDNQLPYIVIANADNRGLLASRYEASALPTTYVVGANGVIIARLRGAGHLLPAVQQALAQYGLK